METILFFIAAAGASLQAIIGFGFFISCVCAQPDPSTGIGRI
jgi:hypothetical protein